MQVFGSSIFAYFGHLENTSSNLWIPCAYSISDTVQAQSPSCWEIWNFRPMRLKAVAPQPIKPTADGKVGSLFNQLRLLALSYSL